MSVAGLTACGDKVNVTQPAPDSAVTQVTVSPASQTLGVGDKFTFVATVVAGPQQTNRNVTWSSSNPAVASVDNAGVVTAIKGGVTSIIAASVANPAIKGAAAVTVNEVVASVTIGQINQTKCDAFGGCTSVPAVLSNVANQLDVTLNVDAGTQKISEVDLIMNCGTDTIVQKQTFGAANVAPDAENASAPTTLSFNTAAFNPTTGAVAFKNGVCTIKAKAITSSGTQVASGTQQLTLNNADGVIIATTNSGSTAADAKGSPWKSGAITVAATPVLYSGRTPATFSIKLPGAAVAETQVVPASATGTTSATWSSTSSSAPNVRNLTLKAGVNADGFAIPIHPTVLVVDSNGQDIGLIQLNATSQSDVRIDNQAPDITTVPPVINLNVQNATNGWLGAAFVFSTTGGASTRAVTLDATTTADNGGVDVVAVTPQWSPTGAGTWTSFSKVSDLAETSSSATLDLRLRVCDALQNCANTVAPFPQFGVDLTPPTLTQTGGVKDGSVFNIGTGVPTTVSFGSIDTSKTTGISGSGLSATPLRVADQGLKPDAVPGTGSKTDCSIGNPTGSGNAITCSSGAAEPLTFTLPAQAQQSGEYTMVVTAVDQAGNASPALTIKYYNDQLAPSVTGGVTIPASITANTSFTGLSATDDMDVRSGNGNLQFTAPAVLFFEGGSATPAGATFDNALTRASSVTVTMTTFYRSLADASAGVPNAAGTLPTTLNTRATDAAGNPSASNPVALPAANIGTPVAWSNTSTTNGITTFSIDSVKPANPVDPGKAITFSINAKPANATAGNPIQTVCLFYQATAAVAGLTGAVPGELVKIGCSSAGATVGADPNRFFFYQVTWTPPAGFADAGAVNVFAVGNSAANDALISGSVSVNVVTPP